MDAADYSIGDYCSTHGFGSYQLHGDIDLSTPLEMTRKEGQAIQFVCPFIVF